MLEQLENFEIQTKGYNELKLFLLNSLLFFGPALSQRRAIHQSTADPAIYAHCHLHYQRSTRSLSAKLRYHLRTFTSSHFPPPRLRPVLQAKATDITIRRSNQIIAVGLLFMIMRGPTGSLRGRKGRRK